ncbi:hypothetical protein M5K25_022009 [Dendrobium thyrsiflorum]|uniref:Uncharacterized protein n=1 Tax=Dendrobium thyrsiflorum TaxID=117978 RepID=A0ABD0U5H9_DENTH
MENPPLSLLIPLLLLLFLLLLISLTTSSPTPDRRRLIDNIIHSAALHSYPKRHKTAVPYAVSLPLALSAATAHAMRFRAGRLRRQGADFKEFHLSPGLVAHPHSKRLLIVHQNLGNLSDSLYSLPGYQLISPVLGLLIYDAIGSNSTELDVKVTKAPIELDFSRIAGVPEIKEELLCAVFGLGKQVEVLGRGRVCLVKGQGHFGLVVERGMEKVVRRWKLVVAAATAGAMGAVLIGLVVVAVVKGKKKERRMAEMERRAYENEALRVSMVGHLRAYTAAAVRTAPAMEREEDLPM